MLLGSLHIKNSPFTARLVTAPAVPERTFLFGPGIDAATAGEAATVFLQTRDAFDNFLDHGLPHLLIFVDQTLEQAGSSSTST